MNRRTAIATTAIFALTAVMLSPEWSTRSNLLQQPHSTKITATGEATLDEDHHPGWGGHGHWWGGYPGWEHWGGYHHWR